MVTIYRFLFKKKSKELSDFDIEINIIEMMHKSYYVMFAIMILIIIFKIWLLCEISALIDNNSK